MVFVSFIYFGVLFLLSIFFIIVYFIKYKDYFTSCKVFLFFKSRFDLFAHSSFVLVPLQELIYKSKVINIPAKLSHIHEILFHEKIYSGLPKGSLYTASFDKRGYDSKSLHSQDLGNFIKGDFSGLQLYEFKKVSNQSQKFYDKLSQVYSKDFKLSGYPNVLEGFRPKGVKSVEVGFFEFKHFKKAESTIVKPENINLVDFSEDFDKLLINNKKGALDSNTVLTKECLERLNIFIDSYTTGENKEFCELVIKLTSPGGSLHGLL